MDIIDEHKMITECVQVECRSSFSSCFYHSLNIPLSIQKIKTLRQTKHSFGETVNQQLTG